MNINLHHIGFIVDNIEKSIQMFELFGFKKESELVEDYNQNNFLQMLKDDRNNKIELIKPMNETSSVANCNLGMHHLAFSTDNEEEFLRLLKQNKFGKIFTSNIEAPLFNNKEVFFGLLKNDLIFEIVKD